MPAINISNIVVGCAGSTDGTGTVSFDFSSALSGGSFQIKLSGDGPTYGPTPVASASGDGSGSFTGVADGVYQITVIHSGGTTGSTAQNITVSCAAPPAVDCSAFEWLNEANAVTDWADTGNLDLDFAALAGTDQGSLASVVLNPGNIAATSIAVVGGLSRAKFDALPAGSYSFLATTSEGCTLTGNLVLPLYGCIDPLASTYNPLANAQDPDVPCVPWPAATPVFTIPACQSLSFVPQSAAADNCTYPDPTRVLTTMRLFL